MKAINLRLVLVVLFSIAVNAANAQVKKKRSLPKKQKIEMVANTNSLLNVDRGLGRDPKLYTILKQEKLPAITTIYCCWCNHQPRPELPKMEKLIVAQGGIRPNLPGGVLNKQIEVALGNAGGSRPENVVYYIDGIMVRSGSNGIQLRDNSFRK